MTDGGHRTVYEARWFALMADATGTEYVRCGDGVLVVPVMANGDVVLIREPSAAFGDTALLLPTGEKEPGEDPADTANRELQEEIGYRAGRIEPLGEVRPFEKYLTTRFFTFLARDLEPSRLAGDEDYEIGIEPVPLAGFESLIDEGRLLDACAIATLYRARARLDGSAP